MKFDNALFIFRNNSGIKNFCYFSGHVSFRFELNINPGPSKLDCISKTTL